MLGVVARGSARGTNAMGKGDKRTRRGKINRGAYGVSRPRKRRPRRETGR